MTRKPIPDILRGALIERFGRTCQYCGLSTDSLYRDPAGNPWHIDHILAVSRGGTNEEANLTLACQSCNLTKHNAEPIRDRRTGRIVFHRRRHVRHLPVVTNAPWLRTCETAKILGMAPQTLLCRMGDGAFAWCLERGYRRGQPPRFQIYIWSIQRWAEKAGSPPEMLQRLEAATAKRWGAAA